MNRYIFFRVFQIPNEEDSREDMRALKPMEHFARELMNNPDFLAYVEKNGYHFTNSLADCVTKHHLENADGTKHNWSALQVKSALENGGMKNNPLNMTWGDAAYLANWFYSDEYPDTLATETAVIKRTYKAAQDPDGYEGMAFMRWLSDVVGKQQHIDWLAYME